MGIPAALVSFGNVGYGNIALNGSNVRTKSVRSVPRMDAAGRGRTWYEHTINLQLKIGGDIRTDAAVLAMRKTLQTPGLPFSYSDRGYGPLRVNIAQPATDAIWGPIPKELGWQPLGGGCGCIIDWQVSVAIARDFGISIGTAGQAIELLYSVAFDQDDAGYTTRRISVMARVPGTRIGLGFNNKELLGTADEYRDLLAPPLIPGFKRTYPTWVIDESKTVLHGEIVDEELGFNFLPEGVANGQADQDIASTSQGLALWQATINGSFELIKDSPVDELSVAGWFIGTVCKDRIQSTAKALGKNAGAIVPLSLRMREPEIFGRRKVAVSLSYSFTQELKDIFGVTGLWRPVPGSNWLRWAASMTSGPADPRGFAQIRLLPTDDSIVDGNGGRMPGIFTGTPFVPLPPNGPIIEGVPEQVQERVLRAVKNAFPDPQPANSFLVYECWIWLETESGVVPIRPLPVRAPTIVNQVLTANPFEAARGSGWLGANFFDAFNDTKQKMPPNVPSAVAAVQNVADALLPQQRVAPQAYVFLRGHAMRYGFPVPIPALTDYCGVAPVLACRLDSGEGYGHGIFRAGNDKPIYMAKWNLRYLLPGGQKGFWFPPAIPNPLLDNS